MVIKYNSIRMQNFKCFKDQTIEFGNKTQISAMNGKGKSTINDAINWVLFGTLADGTKADKIRPHDASGKDIDMIDITVTLDMEVDGKPINIAKTQKQNWVKHRGNTEAQFEGNVNSYVVNTIPKSEKDYKAYMAELIDEKLFRMTTSANDFLKMKTADKRNTLFELVSDMTDADVIAVNSKFAPIASELKKYKLNEIISRAKKAISDNKKELEEIPARVDATNKMKSDVDVAELELQKNAIKEQIAEIESKLSSINADDTVSKLSNEIMQMQFKISDYRKSANEKLFSQRKEIQNIIDDCESNIENNMRKRINLTREMSALSEKIKATKDEKTDLIDEYKAIQAEEFDESKYIFDEKSTICPVCGREYESDKVEQIKADFETHKVAAINSFNESKISRLSAIESKGILAKKTIDESNVTLEEKNAEFEQIKAEYASIVENKNKAERELSTLPKEVDLSDNQEFASMQTQLANMDVQYVQLKNAENPSKELEIKKSSLQTELTTVEKSIAAADNTRFDEEIERLTARQRELGQLIANCEKELDIYEEFNRTKVKMLTDKINEHFKLVKFVMFEPQVNGGYKEVCNVTVNGSVLGNGLNTGASILAQLDIVSTLQRIKGVSVPVITDNAEQLDSTSLSSINADFQQIYLKVTDDSEMIVEREV